MKLIIKEVNLKTKEIMKTKEEYFERAEWKLRMKSYFKFLSLLFVILTIAFISCPNAAACKFIGGFSLIIAVVGFLVYWMMPVSQTQVDLYAQYLKSNEQRTLEEEREKITKELEA